MSAYTIKTVEEVPDFFEGQYPGAMRMFGEHAGLEQVAFTHRLMPPKSGGKGSYGHRHQTQEELYFVLSGTLQFKLEDDVVDVQGGSLVRVHPDTARSVWNDGPEDAELIIISTKVDDPEADAVIVEDFWPD